MDIQNAPRHGFYARAMSEAENLELEKAAAIEGLDNEIAVFRLELRRILEDHPDRVDLHIRAVNTLARLISTRHKITPEQTQDLKEAMSTVLKEVAIPLGLKFLP